MAKKAKSQPKTKTLYRTFICGDLVGEAEGFFELNDGKLTLITCWSANDASYRDEYMSGLIEYFGGAIERLPEKYVEEAEKMMAKTWGLYDEGDE